MKKAIALILAMAMVFGLTACGGADSDKLVLEIIMSQYGSNTKTWWEGFEASFEAANPDIDLRIDIVSWNDIYSVVTTRISNNNQPDILNISGFADYVADDLLVPAEDYASDAVKSGFIPSFWAANELDGTVWALPILASCRTLIVNTDLLAGAGVSTPTTWEEVMSACAAIKATYGDKIVPWALDISADEGHAAFAYYAWNFGGDFLDANGNWILNSDENVAAVEYIKGLIDAGYCNANPYTDTRYPLQDAFSAGSIAMLIGPGNAVKADSAINYEFAPMPTATGTPVSMGVCDQFMVFKDPKAKEEDPARIEAIRKFFDAFYELDTYAGYMVYEGFLPATAAAAELLPTNASDYIVGGSDTPGDNEYFALFCPMVEDARFYPMGRTEWMDVRNGVIEVEQQVCQGLISAREALDALQAEIAGE